MNYLINVEVFETKCSAEYVGETPITSGSQGELLAQFSFDESWAELHKTAVFYSGDFAIPVVLDESLRCEVPPEVQQFPYVLKVGVIGVGQDGEERPTIIATVTGLAQGAWLPKCEGQAISPDLYAQLIAMIRQLEVEGVSDQRLQELIQEAFPDALPAAGGNADSVGGAMVDDDKISYKNLWTAGQIADFIREHGGGGGHICRAGFPFGAMTVERRI